MEELKALGFEAYAYACDTSDRESVKKLAEYAATLGEIKNVINAAGISPAMGGAGDQEKILRINVLKLTKKLVRPGPMQKTTTLFVTNLSIFW